MNSAKVKAEQLGMSYGKACQILRKSLLFKLMQKCGMDRCVRCEEKIDVINEMSIEHIRPWQFTQDPVGLFFDLDNVAFSHRECNIRYGGSAKKKNRSSNFRGVSKRNGRWRAQIGIRGETYYIGTFDDERKAAEAYDHRIIDTMGNKALTNKKLGLL